MTNAVLYSTLALFLWLPFTMGQTNDFAPWLTLQLEKKINKKVRLSADAELRLQENAQQVGKYFLATGVDYRFSKHVSMGIYYRFIQENERDRYSTQHRFYTDLGLKEEKNRFTFSYRCRLQTQYVDLLTSDLGFVPRRYNRHKFSIKYNVRRFKGNPYLAYELYLPIDPGSEFAIDKHRYTLGLEYPLSKRSQLEVFYRYQYLLRNRGPENIFILGFAYKKQFK